MLMNPASWQFYVREFGPAVAEHGTRMPFFGDSIDMLRHL
jgi:hypothetical protein